LTVTGSSLDGDTSLLLAETTARARSHAGRTAQRAVLRSLRKTPERSPLDGHGIESRRRHMHRSSLPKRQHERCWSHGSARGAPLPGKTRAERGACAMPRVTPRHATATPSFSSRPPSHFIHRCSAHVPRALCLGVHGQPPGAAAGWLARSRQLPHPLTRVSSGSSTVGPAAQSRATWVISHPGLTHALPILSERDGRRAFAYGACVGVSRITSLRAGGVQSRGPRCTP